MGKYEWRKLRKSWKPTYVSEFPKQGKWVPISVAARLKGFSQQMIRFRMMAGEIESIKFNGRGSILVKLEDVKEKHG